MGQRSKDTGDHGWTAGKITKQGGEKSSPIIINIKKI